MKKFLTVTTVLILLFSSTLAVNASPIITVSRSIDASPCLSDLGYRFVYGLCFSKFLIKTGNNTYTFRVPLQISKPITSSSSQNDTPVIAPTPNNSASAMQSEMLSLLNAERANAGAAPLGLDQDLNSGAYLKSKDMAVNGYFDHSSPGYGSPFDMMKSLGITYHRAAENIALNSSVKGAHDAFMNSPGHKANIIDSGFNKVGLGFYWSGSSLYITQWFTD